MVYSSICAPPPRAGRQCGVARIDDSHREDPRATPDCWDHDNAQARAVKARIARCSTGIAQLSGHRGSRISSMSVPRDGTTRRCHENPSAAAIRARPSLHACSYGLGHSRAYRDRTIVMLSPAGSSRPAWLVSRRLRPENRDQRHPIAAPTCIAPESFERGGHSLETPAASGESAADQVMGTEKFGRAPRGISRPHTAPGGGPRQPRRRRGLS